MRLLSLNTVVIALVVLGLVVPTGAVLQDRVWENQPIVVRAADGPNGKYATEGPNGDLKIDLTRAGLNPNALTVIEDVFTITNAGERTRFVWITHEATASVDFSTDRGSIEGRENRARLTSGDRVTVGLSIDTRGSAVTVDDTLIEEFTIHALVPNATVQPPESTPTPNATTPTPTPTPNVTTPTPTPTPNATTPTPTPTPNATTPTPSPGKRVEITVEIEGATVTPMDELPEDDADKPPTARIDRERGGRAGDGLRYRGFDIDALTVANESVTLSALNSTVGSAEAIGQQARALVIANITSPRPVQNSTTIRFRVPRAVFNGTEPSAARVGRFVDGRWQLLDTRVVSRDAESVLLEAKTPGFSVFALFDRDDVVYAWEPEGKDPVPGLRVNLSYADPGLKNVTLRVTDSRGRTASDTYRVLVNDRPRVEVQARGRVRPNETTTLVANVTDEVGNTTVEWLFPDGTRASGTRVQHTFPAGEHRVRVTVEDEFGERVEKTVAIRVASGEGPAIDVLEFTLGLEGRIAVLALLAALGLFVLRRYTGRTRTR